jgi:hypothetical protein
VELTECLHPAVGSIGTVRPFVSELSDVSRLHVGKSEVCRAFANGVENAAANLAGAVAERGKARRAVVLLDKPTHSPGHGACELRGLKRRQVFRLPAGLKHGGAASLVSKRRRRLGNNRLPETYRDLALSLVRERYADFGSDAGGGEAGGGARLRDFQ